MRLRSQRRPSFRGVTTLPTLTRDRWKVDYDVFEGGLVLKNVFHDGDYKLAHDMRVARIWVDTAYPRKTDRKNLRSFVLGSTDLPSDGPVAVLEASAGRTTNPSGWFSGYNN